MLRSHPFQKELPMLDESMKEQLKDLFGKITANIILEYRTSDHQDQATLLEILRSLAELSSKVALAMDGNLSSPVPFFKVLKDGKATGIEFRGVPNGHEFTSLILAILNASGVGRLPDERTIQRIQNIKGPVKISTYVSLTCEICPEVVQTFNQIACLHPEISHEMVDGALVKEEVNRLNISGVPSIFANEKFIHSGKISLNSAIELLEEQFGTQEIPLATDLGHFDVVTIGGGPAGVSAAIYAARKGLKTAVIAEKIGGQVLDTKGIENLISVPYIEGPELAEKLHSHLCQYSITILSDRRVESLSEETRQIKLNSGESLSATSIIIATGAKWRQLNVPGEKEYLGRGVAYCPHCDGPFFKNKKVAVVGGGNSGVEAAIDLSNICREVVLFEFMGNLKADHVLIDKLRSTSNIKVLTNVKVTEVTGNQERVSKLLYQNNQSGDSSFEDVDGIFVQIGLLPNSAIVNGIVELNTAGEILVDVKGRTNKKGIYAAGDVTNSPYKQIITSLGDGAKVALSVFEDQMRAGT